MATKRESPKIFLDQLGKCPNCGGSWDGGERPEKDRENFGPPYRWSLLRGHEDPKVYDGISWYVCPHCNEEWSRWDVTFDRKEECKPKRRGA